MKAYDAYGSVLGSWRILAPNSKDAIAAIQAHVGKAWGYPDTATWGAKRATNDTLMVVHYV